MEDRYNIYRYSSNTVSWHEWVFRQIQSPVGSTVLDIGCGPGTLWTGRTERLPSAVQITLADQSEGMIREAHARLPADDRFAFAMAHVDALPFENRAFDFVLALHMLAHAESVSRAAIDRRWGTASTTDARLLRCPPFGICLTSQLTGQPDLSDLLHLFRGSRVTTAVSRGPPAGVSPSL